MSSLTPVASVEIKSGQLYAIKRVNANVFLISIDTLLYRVSIKPLNVEQIYQKESPLRPILHINTFKLPDRQSQLVMLSSTDNVVTILKLDGVSFLEGKIGKYELKSTV